MKNRILRRVCSLALVLMFALVICVPAFAAEDSMSNFSRVKTYSGQYSDVSSTFWAYGAIQTCYETSLMQGSDGSFKPADNLTVAEALVMADRVHQIYHTGSNTLSNGSPWYMPYVDYAIENGIINDGDFSSYTDKITRADMAYIFSRALPTRELSMLNNIGEIPDVDSAPVRDRNAIWLLYYAGVLTGSDSYGTFKPNDNITRAEAAAIISRIAIPSERRNVVLLYKVEEGIITFGIPQTGVFMKDDSSEFTTYQAVGSGIVSFINLVEEPDLAGFDITQDISAAGMKEIYEKEGYYDISIGKAFFGSTNAYSIKYTGDYSGTEVECFIYIFYGPSGMYAVSISWGSGADRDEVETIINNVLVNGVAASPVYKL